jgi:hypothetical protein
MAAITVKSGGNDVTTTKDYKAFAAAPAAATSLASSILNLIPIDVILPLALSVAIKIATTGTGSRATKVKALLIKLAKAVENEFPGEVCG